MILRLIHAGKFIVGEAQFRDTLVPRIDFNPQGARLINSLPLPFQLQAAFYFQALDGRYHFQLLTTRITLG